MKKSMTYVSILSLVLLLLFPAVGSAGFIPRGDLVKTGKIVEIDHPNKKILVGYEWYFFKDQQSMKQFLDQSGLGVGDTADVVYHATHKKYFITGLMKNIPLKN